MQDMKIEYRDGKLVELHIDGIDFSSATSVSFQHVAGECVPLLTISLPIGVGLSHSTSSGTSENLRIIEKC